MECKAIPPTQLMRQLFLIPARMLRRARCGQGWVQTGANLLYWAVTPAIAVCWLLTIAIALGAGLGSAPTLDALVRVPVLIGAFLVLWGLIVSERRITIVLLHVSITPLSFQPYPVRRLERVSTAWRDAMAWQRAGYFTVKLAASFILAPLVALCGVLGGLLLLVPVYYIIHPYAIGVGARGAPGQAPFVWRDFGGTVVLLPIGFAVVCFAVWQLNTASQEWACFAQKMLGMSDASKRVASALEDAGRAKSHAAATEQRRRMQQASLSHDLRAPLHSIQAHVDDLIESYTAARPMPLPLQSLGIVQREVARLGDALDDLLLLERIDAGHLRPVLIPVQVSPVVVEAVEVHRAQANHRRILLQVEPTTDLPSVLGDRDYLRRVLGNVIANALHYTPLGGIVSISSAHAPGLSTLTVFVRDTGIGMTPEQVGRAFDRYYRADGARSSGGSGLGLAITRDLIGDMGGEVHLDSVPGEGTTVRLVLPLAAAGAAITVPDPAPTHEQDA